MYAEEKIGIAKDLFTDQEILAVSKLSKKIRNKFLECFVGIDLIKIILDQLSFHNDEDKFVKILSLIDFILLSEPVVYDDTLQEAIDKIHREGIKFIKKLKVESVLNFIIQELQ